MTDPVEDWKEAAFKLWNEQRLKQEAEDREQRRLDGNIAIWFEPADDDANTFTREFQDALAPVISSFRNYGIDPKAEFMAVDSVDAVSGYTGFVLAGVAIAPHIATIVTEWLRGRSGRSAKVEFFENGQLKSIEAQTSNQILALKKALSKAVDDSDEASPG